LKIRRWAQEFFGTTEIPFVAIDGSCSSKTGENYVIIYGGAYGSRGIVEISGNEAIITYKRWELNRDVSVVAFIPVPLEYGSFLVSEGEEVDEEGAVIIPLSDREVAKLTTLHTKVMQLAEVYLAYSLARSGSVDAPRLIMMDTTLSGWLGNTSFGPRWISIIRDGKVGGYELSYHDLYVMLAHPINKELNAPAPLLFQPHLRLVAEADWRDTTVLRESELSNVPPEVFKKGAEALEKLKLGSYDRSRNRVELNFEPRASWRKCISAFENVCEKLFREKDPRGLTYVNKHGERVYFTSKDLQFLAGIGLRALIEECWKPYRRILLVGVVKDSYSRYFYRNFLGSLHAISGDGVEEHLEIAMSDRNLLELLAMLVELEAPWATIEFDSCFMTLFPKRTEEGWRVQGYKVGSMPEVTRPPRLFLRSLAQFLLHTAKGFSSHVIFIDRPAYPGWDTADSERLSISTPGLGTFEPLYFSSPPRLQYLTMYLLSVLVRNHFPEALGYPEPLHKADWGARSMRERVARLLDSAWLVDRINPLRRTFRSIRESFRRMTP